MQNNFVGIDVAATCRRLALFIKISGLSDRQLSDILNTSVQSVNKWRHAHNLPDIENMFVICKMLGITLDDLIIATDDRSSKNASAALKRIKEYIMFIRLLAAVRCGRLSFDAEDPLEHHIHEWTDGLINLCIG